MKMKLLIRLLPNCKKKKPEEHFYGDKSASKFLCGLL